METRVAVISIIIENAASVQTMNEILHQYSEYIIGRMGIPYRSKGISIISIAVDAPATVSILFLPSAITSTLSSAVTSVGISAT